MGLSNYYVRAQGWVGGSENGNFSLRYVLKMSLQGLFVVQKTKPGIPKSSQLILHQGFVS